MKSYTRFIIVLSILICAGLAAVYLTGTGDRGEKLPKEISGPRPLPPPEDKPEPVGAQKLKQIYKEGWSYQRTHDWAMGAKGEHLDWGLKRQFFTTMKGRLVTRQKILENKDGQIKSSLKIEQFTTHELKLECTGMEVVIGPVLENLLEAAVDVALSASGPAGKTVAMLPGKVQLAQEKANQILKIESVKNLYNRIPSGHVKQVNAFVESLDGLHLELLYVDGEGVKKYTILGQPNRKSIPVDITNDIEAFLRSYDTDPDAYLFPDKEVEVGQSWNINSEKLPFAFPSQLGEVKVRGTTKLQRKANEKNRSIVEDDPNPGAPALAIYCEDKRNEGKWDDLRPDVRMEFEDQLVRKATLSVRGEVKARSKGHWFFEMNHSSVPELRCTYTCEETPPPPH